MKNKKTIIIITCIFCILLLAGGGYYYYTTTQTATSTAANSVRMGTGSFTRANLGFVNGSVISVNGSNVIVDNGSAGQVIVVVGNTTTIIKSSPSIQADVLQNGATISITGQRNGTAIDATAITIPIARVKPSGTGVPSQTGSRRGFGGGTGGNTSGNPQAVNTTNGTISAVSGNTVTIKTVSGTSYTVSITSNTTYSKQATGTVSDIAVNTKIIASGQKDQTGTITAQTVTIQ